MRHILSFIFCPLLLFSSSFAQPAIANKFVSRSHTFSGTTLPYRLFIPESYSSGTKYPVILFLHSAGERGSDNSSQITTTRMATAWADSIAQLKHPCFVVAPQCPQNGGWSSGNSESPIRPELSTTIDILDSLAREFSIDTNRVYVTGFSMGGSGTWEIIMRFPDRFAAAVPIAGGTNPAFAYRLTNVPIWNFHGSLDQLVPVQYSRMMIDSLRALGRQAVYTHCHNLDCFGLPDSVIQMHVRSHADLMYTEIQGAGHTYSVWGSSSNYPFLPDWLFDKYKKQPGSVTLTTLKSYTTLSGNAAIEWTSSIGDSVEVWFSPDAGSTSIRVVNAPNTGSFAWNTTLVPDCAIGSVSLFLKTAEGFIIGSDRSSTFSVNNTLNGPPFVRLLNEEFTTGIVVTQDSLGLKALVGDPSGAILSALVEYSSDSGATFSRVDSFNVVTDPTPQIRWVDVRSLANSDRAVIALTVSNGVRTARATSFPFTKNTLRSPGPDVTHTIGASGATVKVNVVSPSVLTGHSYRVTFEDATAEQKHYRVRDMNLGADVVVRGTELDGVKEGPLFDGVRLVIADVTTARVIADSTRWVVGSATLNPTVRVASGGRANFFDYRITLFSSVVDTSLSGFGPPANPMKFIVWNMTRNRQADVVFADVNGDNTIGSDVTITIVEADSSGNPVPAWTLVFVWQPDVVSPLAGDEFRLCTTKPLSASDVYEFTTTVTEVDGGADPVSFSLDQNFPNPFNPATAIRFTLAKSANVHLSVYDLLGRRVAVLVNERLGAGSHLATFDGSRLASGVYFSRLQADSFVATRKLCLIR